MLLISSHHYITHFIWPASRMRETAVAVHDDTKPRRKFEPQDIGTPAMCMLSLTASVLPDNLPLLAPTISVIHALHILFFLCISYSVVITYLYSVQTQSMTVLLHYTVHVTCGLTRHTDWWSNAAQYPRIRASRKYIIIYKDIIILYYADALLLVGSNVGLRRERETTDLTQPNNEHTVARAHTQTCVMRRKHGKSTACVKWARAVLGLVLGMVIWTHAVTWNHRGFYKSRPALQRTYTYTVSRKQWAP